MPTAITPRRRSRDDVEADEEGSASLDLIPSSQPELPSRKRTRLTNGNASSSLSGTPLTNGYHPQSSVLQRETLQARDSRKTYQPGSIVRVELKNFVTYTAVEFFPGPSLNMVIGPNGTGKSTLVCAICLGLGWGPQHLGRAKEVSEYVKHGCQEAMIEIELAKDGKRFKNNIVIRCTIKRDGNKTVFSINGRPQGKKAVIELCRSLSIQIDNLCQFLPQDKVVEFAAMTPVELLRSTQRAVASQVMIDMHENLKDLRRKQKDIQAKNIADQEQLANLESRQRLQEADVERMREREQIETHVKMLEAARPFAAYRSARSAHGEAKENRKAAQTELTRLEKEVEPSLRAVNAKEQYKAQIAAVVTERKTVISKHERHADSIDKKFKDLQDKHNELVAADSAEKSGGKKHRLEIARLEGTISQLKRQMEVEPSELDVQAYNRRIREKRDAVDDSTTRIGDLKKHQEELKRRGVDKNYRIKQAQDDLAQLDSQAGKQKSKLQGASRDTFKLWEWVQQNRNQFEEPVFGPPIVECTIKEPKYVDHIESLFQKSVMISFTVQTKGDFKRLSDQAHARMHLSEINIRTVPAGLDPFRPPVSAEQMQQFGFEGWALDFLNGPEPVLAMLCAEVHIHEAGIALRDTTPQQFELLQNSPIQSWVTSKSTYRINRRREYGPGAKFTLVKDIRRASVWTDQPVDLTAKRELQENIQGWTEEVASLQAESDGDQKKILAYRNAINVNSEEGKAISAEKEAKQKALGEFKALPTKLAAQEAKLATAQNALGGIKGRLREIMEEQETIALERGQIALYYADAVEAIRVAHNSLHEAEIMLIEATSDFETLRERNSSVEELLEDQRSQVDALVKETEALQKTAKALLDKCTQLLARVEDGLKSFLVALPANQTSEQLEGEIESEKARLELMHEGNGGVIKEYEQRKKKIEVLTARLEEIKNALSEFDDKIKELRDQWEPELDSLVGKISNSFSLNMEQISCAGEVGVYKDEDFDQWAIQIRVKFRESEPLTTLDSHRQSGGERAVSTIFYLMSLQSLTRSPFRVVDEINQGMDPRNERLVHKRMVGIACGIRDGAAQQPQSLGNGHEEEDVEGGLAGQGRGGSQYFLITPKLLHNLTYERGMRVLCIASGEYMPADRSRVDFKGCVDLMRGLKAGAMAAAAG
ncbi:MAG: Structural maintenance of chromosomes protein 5 [Alectoria fallacina]|uniref:Structural maintenance of chromosomes protein 5 n=1 Tax=Alectoria fallacina TaxID=1903189 RepID=A0A8H3G2S3_9LECA|nr:MAG: Structural maintenance of chromosomes protein 5 [Alectoria fallacina]